MADLAAAFERHDFPAQAVDEVLKTLSDEGVEVTGLPAEEAEVAVAALEPERLRIRRLVEGRAVTPALLRRLAGRGFSRDALEEIAAAFAHEA